MDIDSIPDSLRTTGNYNAQKNKTEISKNQKPKPTRNKPISQRISTLQNKSKSGGGQGFGNNIHHKTPKNVGIDHLGRVLTEVWVGGRSVVVADPPKTRPNR